MNTLSVSFVVLATIVACAKTASIGDALLTVYTEPLVPEANIELYRDKRDPEALARGHLIHHHHHHLGGGGGGNQEYYSKPTSCKSCGGYEENHGSGGGATATFAQSSAGTINTNGGHGGHGGLGSQSSSQSAAYNFGPFSASFSASQSNGNGGFYGNHF